MWVACLAAAVAPLLLACQGPVVPWPQQGQDAAWQQAREPAALAGKLVSLPLLPVWVQPRHVTAAGPSPLQAGGLPCLVAAQQQVAQHPHASAASGRTRLLQAAGQGQTAAGQEVACQAQVH